MNLSRSPQNTALGEKSDDPGQSKTELVNPEVKSKIDVMNQNKVRSEITDGNQIT